MFSVQFVVSSLYSFIKNDQFVLEMHKFIEKLFSKIVIDTNYQDTFILEVARYASEITIDSFKSNQNYQLNDSELVRISDHFGFNKMNDFYTAFNNSAKYMGILSRDSKKSPKPPSRLPCLFRISRNYRSV